jgi:hypothetical protein
MAPTEEAGRWFGAVSRNWLGFLYDLIQPRRLPARPKSPPRLRVEILVTVLGLAGWVLFLGYYDRVSPAAALDLRYSRAEIAQRSGEYARARGFDLDGYRQVVTFERDPMAQVYLERTLGVPELNRLVGEREVPVFWWRVRWFVPEQREEYNVFLLPTGEVNAFARTLAEDAPAESAGAEEAQRLAEAYLTADRNLSLDAWDLYDVSARTLPNRTDHTLTWVKKGLETGDGDVRISVTVQGDEVGQFNTWFRVPEAFSRVYTGQRSRAYLLDGLATGLAMIFLLGGLLTVVWGFALGLRLGWAPVIVGLAAGLVDLVDSLNYLPLLAAGYDTALDYRTYLLGRLVDVVSSAVLITLAMAFLVLAARWLVRAVWPRQHKLKPDPEAPWAQMARSGWRGMMLGGLMGAYLILFYALAQALGAWAPLRTPPLNLLATPLPFVAAIWLGLVPALSEELAYRALGIGLMMRLVRGRVWLALLVPSLLWGFAHASYLTDPVGLRGIELTLSSLLLSGLFFLLFDLTTVIVAHYTYNASLIAIVLVRSGQPLFVVTGLLAVLLGLLPAAIWLVRRLRGRRPAEPGALAIAVGGEADRAEAEALGGAPLPEPATGRRLLCLRSGSGRLLGYALGEIAGSAPGERTGQVLSIYVAEGNRGRYHGTALYRALAAWFRDEGAGQVEVQVPLGSAGSSTFWAMQRFRPRARLWARALAGDGTSEMLADPGSGGGGGR